MDASPIQVLVLRSVGDNTSVVILDTGVIREPLEERITFLGLGPLDAVQLRGVGGVEARPRPRVAAVSGDGPITAAPPPMPQITLTAGSAYCAVPMTSGPGWHKA